MNRFLLYTLLSVFAFSANAEDLKVGGGAAPINNIFKPISGPFKSASGVSLVLIEGGPDIAWKDLQEGKVEVAAAGLSLEDWKKLMESKNIKVDNPDQYKSRIVGRDKIKVLAHAGVSKVKSLSRDQLKGLFTGKIKNWKEVGGPNLAVKAIYGDKIPGTNKLWQEKIMDGEAFAKDVAVTDMPSIVSAIAANEGSIAIGSLGGSKNDKIYVVEDIPDVSRPITVITKGEPSDKVKKLYDFISKDGQKYIIR